MSKDDKKKKKTHIEDEAGYRITMKGIAWMAAYDVGWIDSIADEKKFDRFWDRFKLCMRKAGYVHDESDLSA